MQVSGVFGIIIALPVLTNQGRNLVEYFTVLIHSGTNQGATDTFKAADFNEALNIVQQKFPDKAYRLYRGENVPERKSEQKIPPTLPESSKKK